MRNSINSPPTLVGAKPTLVSNLLSSASNLPSTHFTLPPLHPHFNHGKRKIDHHNTSATPHNAQAQGTQNRTKSSPKPKPHRSQDNNANYAKQQAQHNTTQKTDKEPLSNFLN
jgi:hypothetical protein